MKSDPLIQKRLTVLIYNAGGSFVRLRLFSQKALLTAGTLAAAAILLIGFVVTDYVRLKAANYQSRDLIREVKTLSGAIKEKDKQIERFDTRIHALQLKLVKLHHLEEEIRSYTGIYNNLKDTGDYAVGGAFPDIDDPKICTEEIYYDFLEKLNDRLESIEGASDQQAQEFQLLWGTLKEIRAIRQVTPSLRPVDGGWISSGFGRRKSPFTGAMEFHSGVDIAAHVGTPVVATAAGTVIFSGYKGALGKAVVIDHGFGIVTRYGHLDKYRVKAGQNVARGEVIGKVGTTGRSTGPHLHYEVRLNDIPVNAEKYMSEYLAQKDPS